MRCYNLAGFVVAAMLAACGPSQADALQEVAAAHDKGQDASELAALTPLANQGDAAAQFKLGVMNARGWVGLPRPDYAQAREWYQKSAVQGFALAEAALGSLYSNGWSVTRDRKMARYWWEKAAAQGDKAAQSNIAVTDWAEQQLAKNRRAASQTPVNP